MKKKFLLGLLLLGLLGGNAFSQSCPDATIRDVTNNVDCSGQTIQLTCPMPFVTLSPKVFAPGASDSYIYESIPFTPPCTFNLSEYPNKIDYILPNDDVWGEVMSLDFGQPSTAQPFIFSFYGQNNLSQCVVGSNGVLSWNLGVASGNQFNPSNYCTYSAGITLPSTNSEFLNCIFAPYHDIYYNANNNWGKMYFYIAGEYPCRKLILSFYDVPLFGNTNVHATSMLVLYETTNTIEFYLPSKTCCTSTNSGNATLGIQNQTGTQAVVITNGAGVTYNSTNWTATNEAWRIRPEGNLNSWTAWYRRPASGGARTPVAANDNFEAIANPTSAEGAHWYIMETTIQRLDGVNLIYLDSCLINPIELDPFIITHNGNVGLYDTICLGSNMNISLEGGASYRMISPSYQDIANPNSIVVSPTVNTTYIFEVDNLNEYEQLICTRKDSIKVHPRTFNVSLANDMTICKNDTIRLWNTNENLVAGTSLWYYDINNPISTDDTLVYSPQTTGTINFKLTDNFECEATTSINVTVNEAPVVSISGEDRICLGDLTNLTANSSLPNCTYLWSTGQATSTISTRPIENETEYEVSVKYGPAQCETIETIIVTALNKPIVTANQDVNICYSDSAQIYVSGDAENYFWKSFPVDADAENSTLTNLTVRPHESTMYFAHGLNDIGCENIDTVIVFVNPLPVAQMSFNPTVVNDLDPTVIFSDETNGSVSRRWLLSDGATSTESIFVHLFELSDTNQSYQINLYVQNDAGCQDSVVNSIRIAKTHYLWAPNAIYVYDPDPRISQFRVYIDNPVEFELQIYNRWGECIYTANNQEKAWNGTHKGEIVPQGSYVWVAKYRYAGKRNEVVTDKGTFSLYK